MRDLFPGYYRPTIEQFVQMWQECIFSTLSNSSVCRRKSTARPCSTPIYLGLLLYSATSTIINDEDVQRAGTMHALHADELDIAGGRWSRDEGDGM